MLVRRMGYAASFRGGTKRKTLIFSAAFRRLIWTARREQGWRDAIGLQEIFTFYADPRCTGSEVKGVSRCFDCHPELSECAEPAYCRMLLATNQIGEELDGAYIVQADGLSVCDSDLCNDLVAQFDCRSGPVGEWDKHQRTWVGYSNGAEHDGIFSRIEISDDCGGHACTCFGVKAVVLTQRKDIGTAPARQDVTVARNDPIIACATVECVLFWL